MVNRKIDSTNNDTNDDTEGHSRKIAADDKSGIDTTDTEGHAIRILPDHKGRSVDDADSDDTEGHAKASRF